MADRHNPSGHGPTQARTQSIHAFTVTKLGQVVPNVPHAFTPLATKPGNENHVTISKQSIGQQHPARATLAMEDKENHLGKIALQQQRPSMGKTSQPIHTGSMAKHLNKQSFGNTMIAPAPTKALSKASTQLPPNTTTELTHAPAGTPTPTSRRDYKSNQQVVHEIKKFLPTFTFFFDSVDTHTQAILTKHLENLQAKITMFFSKTVTHVITTHPIPDKETIAQIREAAQTQSTGTANAPSSIPPKIPPTQPDRRNMDNVVYKAIKFGSKVWSVEKLCGLLTPLVGEIRVKKTEDKDLRGMLLQEQVFGLGATQTDDSAKSDFHVFKDLYVLVEDTTGRYQTIMAREFPSAPGVEPEYPRFYMESTSRTPYVSVERKKVYAHNAITTVAGKKGLTIDGKAANRTPTPPPSKMDSKRAPHALASGIINSVTSNIVTTTSIASTQPGIVSNTQDRAVEQLGRRVLQSTVAEAGMATSLSKKTPFAHPGLVDRGLSLLNPDASRSKGSPSHPQPSRASIDLARPLTPTPKTPQPSLSLTPSVKMATAQHPTVPSRPPTPIGMQPPRPPTPVLSKPVAGTLAQPRTGGMPEIPGLNEPWDPRKHGYCENCRIGYTNLDDHIETKLHMKFSKDERRFAHLDLLLAKVQRKSKPVAPIIQEASTVEAAEPMQQDTLPAENVAGQEVIVESFISAVQEDAVTVAPLQEPLTVSPPQYELTMRTPTQSIDVREMTMQAVSIHETVGQEPALVKDPAPILKLAKKSKPKCIVVDEDELSSELSRLGVNCADEQTVIFPADDVTESTTISNIDLPVQDAAAEIESPVEVTENNRSDTISKDSSGELAIKVPSVRATEAPFDSQEGIVGVDNLPSLPDVDQDEPYLPMTPAEPSRVVTSPIVARFPRTTQILAQENITSQLETDVTQPDDKFLDGPSEAPTTEITVPASPSASLNEDPVEQSVVLRTPRRRWERHSSDPDQSGSDDIVSMVLSPCAGRTRSSRLRERFSFGSSSVLLAEEETTPTSDRRQSVHLVPEERESSPVLITHGKRKLESVFAKQFLADHANHIPPPSTTMSAIPDMAPSPQPLQSYQQSLSDTPTHSTSLSSSFQFQAWPQLPTYQACTKQSQGYSSTTSPHVPQPSSLRNVHATQFPSQYEAENSNPFLQGAGWDNQQYYSNNNNSNNNRAYNLSDNSYGHSSQERYPTPSQHRPQTHYNPQQHYQRHQPQHVPYHRAIPQVHHHLEDRATLSLNDLAVHVTKGTYNNSNNNSNTREMTDYAPTSATSPMTHFAHSPGTGTGFHAFDPISSSPMRTSPSVRRVQVMSFAEQEQERCYYHYLGNRLPEPAGQKKMRTSPSLVDDDDAAEYGEDCVMYLE
ncbi:hypothetical protein BGZ82_009146 [Podila clonocystis]|nr:hypothetical protein BGZ82_009146 [Podila clonocystis]